MGHPAVAASRLHILLAGLVLSLPAPGFAAIPEIYSGELNTCQQIAAETARGRSLEASITSLIRSYNKASDRDLLPSIQRAIIDHSIRTCGHNASIVVVAAYRAGVPLPVVVGSAWAAGVSRSSISLSLLRIGVDLTDVEAAFMRAEAPPEPPVALFHAPPFTVEGGLGSASPFRP